MASTTGCVVPRAGVGVVTTSHPAPSAAPPSITSLAITTQATAAGVRPGPLEGRKAPFGGGWVMGASLRNPPGETRLPKNQASSQPHPAGGAMDNYWGKDGGNVRVSGGPSLEPSSGRMRTLARTSRTAEVKRAQADAFSRCSFTLHSPMKESRFTLTTRNS